MLFGKTLVLAPHTDDAELGCGATISRLLEDGAEVHVVAFSRAEDSLPSGMPSDTLETEFRASMRSLGVPEACATVHRFPVRRFPEHRQSILDLLVKTRAELKPDVVMLPSRRDIHQDHGVIAAEGLRAFKATSCLGYELPWNVPDFAPEVFVRVELRHIEEKWRALECYRTQLQLGRSYFSRGFFEGLARLRGVQVGAEFAEGFEVLRLIV